MATLTQPVPNRVTINPWALGWTVSAGILAALLTLLTIYVIDNRMVVQDKAVMDWVTGWEFPGLSGLLTVVSLATGSKAGFVYGPLGIGILLLLGKTREAIIFGAVGFTIAAVAILGDYTLGQLVGRGRPLAAAGDLTPAFPSGHVFGSTVFFGFMAFLAVYYQLNRKLLIPVLATMALLLVMVGPARVYAQAHWPTDIAADYLLGGLWLLVIIPAFLYVRKTSWMSPQRQADDLLADGCSSCRIEKSIASLVLLDPERGTATKMYRPPAIVRLLYWLAFQARFPYVGNRVALGAATHRRKVASLLTQHRFGKDLVAGVLAVNDTGGQYEFVTEFVPGEKVGNDAEAKLFLTQVSETFAESGLSVWQVNPHSPHAHTNLIRTPEGDLKIIDLESAVVTPFLAKGQRRAALKAGNFPVFDDIDLPRMRGYLASNATALEISLGSSKLAELESAVANMEQDIIHWKESELRLWGRLARWSYRLLNWKGAYQSFVSALQGADQAAESFFSAGVDRWGREGRLAPMEAAALKQYLGSTEVHSASRHLGVHLVMSAILRFPVGSIMRLAWTVTFWVKLQLANSHRGIGSPEVEVSNIHNPAVMLLSVIPGLGAVAYLASRPLRRKLLVRLMLDQAAWKLPFKLYSRMRLGQILAPSVNHVGITDNQRRNVAKLSTG